MTLLRARTPWILCAFLVACGGQAVIPTDDSGGSSGSSGSSGATDANGNKWVPVPFTPEAQGPVDDDPNFKPVSIKMPAASGSSSSSSSSSSSGSSGSSGSSSGWSSSSSSSGYPSPPPGDLPPGPMTNDIDDPEIATVCADRASSKGSFAFTPALAAIDPTTAHVSVTRDLTEHRWGDAIYRTSFTLFFRTGSVYVDPQYGATRHEAVSSLIVHLDSPVSQPTAFTVGQQEAVQLGWGDGDDTYECGRDGYFTYWSDAEALPHQNAVVTLTRRDGTGLAGTIDIENGKQTLTFDAPFGESFPGADGICCLK